MNFKMGMTSSPEWHTSIKEGEVVNIPFGEDSIINKVNGKELTWSREGNGLWFERFGRLYQTQGPPYGENGVKLLGEATNRCTNAEWQTIGTGVTLEDGIGQFGPVELKRLTGQTATFHRAEFHRETAALERTGASCFIRQGNLDTFGFVIRDIQRSAESTLIGDITARTLADSGTFSEVGTLHETVVEHIVDDIYRVGVVFSPDVVGTYTFGIKTGTTEPTDYMDVGGGQVEVERITDYIPTNGSPATRASCAGALRADFGQHPEWAASLGKLVTQGDRVLTPTGGPQNNDTLPWVSPHEWVDNGFDAISIDGSQTVYTRDIFKSVLTAGKSYVVTGNAVISGGNVQINGGYDGVASESLPNGRFTVKITASGTNFPERLLFRTYGADTVASITDVDWEEITPHYTEIVVVRMLHDHAGEAAFLVGNGVSVYRGMRVGSNGELAFDTGAYVTTNTGGGFTYSNGDTLAVVHHKHADGTDSVGGYLNGTLIGYTVTPEDLGLLDMEEVVYMYGDEKPREMIAHHIVEGTLTEEEIAYYVERYL